MSTGNTNSGVRRPGNRPPAKSESAAKPEKSAWVGNTRTMVGLGNPTGAPAVVSSSSRRTPDNKAAAANNAATPPAAAGMPTLPLSPPAAKADQAVEQIRTANPALYKILRPKLDDVIKMLRDGFTPEKADKILNMITDDAVKATPPARPAAGPPANAPAGPRAAPLVDGDATKSLKAHVVTNADVLLQRSQKVPPLSGIQNEIKSFKKRKQKIQKGLLDAGHVAGAHPGPIDRGVLLEAGTLLKHIDERLHYLETLGEKNPFTKGQVYVSKKLDGTAALTVLAGYKSDPNLTAPQKQALDDASAQLKARQVELDRRMNSPDRDEHVADPNDLLGPAGQGFSPKGALNKAKAPGGALPAKVPGTQAKAKKQAADMIQDGIRKQLFGGKQDISQFCLESADVNENDFLRMFIDTTLQRAGVKADEKEINARQGAAHLKARNEQPWNKIERQANFRDKNGQPVACDSAITPASRLGGAFADMNGQGVCSHDTKSYKHATAMAATELKIGGKTVFAGMRHGVNSARGIKPEMLQSAPVEQRQEMVETLLSPEHWKKNGGVPDAKLTAEKLAKKSRYGKKCAKEMKQKANANRALDVVTGAVAGKHDEIARALANGQPPKITLTSVGLLTPGLGGEGGMIKDQRDGWDAVSGKKHKIKLKQPVTLPDGKVVDEAEIEVEVNSLNFGVNAPAFGFDFFDKGKAPGKAVKKMVKQAAWVDTKNGKAMDSLIGPRSARKNGFAGQVGDWITTKEWEKAVAKKQGQDLTEIDQQIAEVKSLAKQVADLWDSEEFKNPGTEPYKMPAHVAVLANKLGQTPSFNCKSGKDRTGQMDVECKLLAADIATNGGVPPIDQPVTKTVQDNRLDMALNSGSLEMQQLNSGHMGYKVGGVKAIDKAYGDKAATDAFRGTSKHTDKYSAG